MGGNGGFTRVQGKGDAGLSLISSSKDRSSHHTDPEQNNKAVIEHLSRWALQSVNVELSNAGDKKITLTRHTEGSFTVVSSLPSYLGTHTYRMKEGDGVEAAVTVNLKRESDQTGWRVSAPAASGVSREARLLACAASLAEAHVAEAFKASDKTANVDFTVHLGDDHAQVAAIQEAIQCFLEKHATANSLTICGTVKFSGKDKAELSGHTIQLPRNTQATNPNGLFNSGEGKDKKTDNGKGNTGPAND